MLLKAISKFVPADDKNIEYSDYALLDFVKHGNQKIARMKRPLDSPQNCYN